MWCLVGYSGEPWGVADVERSPGSTSVTEVGCGVSRHAYPAAGRQGPTGDAGPVSQRPRGRVRDHEGGGELVLHRLAGLPRGNRTGLLRCRGGGVARTVVSTARPDLVRPVRHVRH